MGIVWVAGRVHSYEPYNWSLLGVFSEESLAVKRCTQEFDFIGPIALDEILPEEIIEWVGGYYPNIKNDTVGEC